MKKRILSLALALVMCFGLSVPAFAAESFPFTDVIAGVWYRDDVAAAYATGLLNGATATRFNPTGHLTLAQAVTLAARLHQYAAEGKVTLANGADVWYSTFVNYAKNNGIIDGSYDGRWGRDATRAEMVKILYRALPASRYQEINDVEDNAIPDVKLDYAYGKEVYAFYRAGILTGSKSTFQSVINGEGFFRPQDTIARSEVAAILNRMLNPGQRKRFALALPELPDTGAKLTEENVFALLDNLDPDGAWIIRSADTDNSNTTHYVNGVKVEGADNFMSWFISDMDASFGTAAGKTLPTAVHEECHHFTRMDPSYAQGKWNYQEKIYTGEGEYITVTFTDTFPTEEMSKLLPTDLRSSRYKTYVSEGASASANQQGIYGLLNEFAAYCWGNNNLVKTYDYCAGYWGNRYTNEFVSCAEFRFWILSYMLYAKENHPETYQGILGNDDFRLAFSTIDDQFADVIQAYFGKLKDAGRSVHPEFKGEYDKLTAIMERPEYVEMAELLKP